MGDDSKKEPGERTMIGLKRPETLSAPPKNDVPIERRPDSTDNLFAALQLAKHRHAQKQGEGNDANVWREEHKLGHRIPPQAFLIGAIVLVAGGAIFGILTMMKLVSSEKTANVAAPPADTGRAQAPEPPRQQNQAEAPRPATPEAARAPAAPPPPQAPPPSQPDTSAEARREEDLRAEMERQRQIEEEERRREQELQQQNQPPPDQVQQ